MKSASPTNYSSDTVIDVVPVLGNNHQEQHSHPPSNSGQLVKSQPNFSSVLAPLNKQSFTKVVKEVEEKLKVVNQTLGMLDNILDSQGFDAILNEMLQSITLKTGELPMWALPEK